MIGFIEVDTSLRHHRKLLRLERTLGRDARWLVIWLWLYTLETARENGNLSSLTDEDLAAVLAYEGDGKKLRAALIDAGFLTAEGHVSGWAERYAKRFSFYAQRARKAAEVRWSKRRNHTVPDLTVPDLRKHRQASSKDATGMHKGSAHSDADGEGIYALYLKKVGKTAALKAIGNALGRVDAQDLKDAVSAFAAAVAKWPAERRQFIPNPATWFNQGRWEDDPSMWEAASLNGSTPKPKQRRDLF